MTAKAGRVFKLLRIDSSPMGASSISRALTDVHVQAWLGAHPGGRVISRDLARLTPPAIDAAWIAANLTPKERRQPAEEFVLAPSTELTRELLEADHYVVGVAMHNWGPPACLKLWADQIVRFGETVAQTVAGPRGALEGKRATFLVAGGAAYRPDAPAAFPNLVEPWLRTLFGHLGVSDLRFLTADRTAEIASGRIDRAAFLARHAEAVRTLLGEAAPPG